jgi:septum formation protein
MLRLILGSASPRRVALLRQLGLAFEQMVSPQEEKTPGAEEPSAFALASACAKAGAVLGLLRQRGQDEGALVIGADTIVCIDGEILGKPADAAQARAMLRRLSGRQHQVHTGLALATGKRLLQDRVTTRVQMRPLSEAQIAWYVDSGEPLDKAGAYGIQGLGARFIESIEGCYYNVVGLPLARLCALLEEAGYDLVAKGWSPNE